MLNRHLIVAACLMTGVVALPPAWSATSKTILMRVTADRVNVRAKPTLDSEVVAQVTAGDVLIARSFMEEWVEIMPPDGVDLWVHQEFIEDNKVTASKLNIRAGAGINYSVVGILERGDHVRVLGTFGEWLQIEPPSGSGLWVSSKLVEMVDRKKDKKREKPEVLKKPEPERKRERPPAQVRTTERGVPEPAAAAGDRPEEGYALPSDLNLIPLEGQGKEVALDGILKRVGFVFTRPSRFRLVSIEGPRAETLCYVRGNIQQLTTFLGQRMKVKGKLYWVQDARYPVLVPEQIAPLHMP